MVIDVVQIELNSKYQIDIGETNGYAYGIEDCQKIFADLIGKSNVEMLGILCLNSENKIINYSNLAIGDINKLTFSTAQIAKVALLSNASKVIIAHNHPTGVLEITNNDLSATKEIWTLLKKFDITLLDSIIVNSAGNGVSIREKIGE